MNIQQFIRLYLKAKNFRETDICQIIDLYNQDFRAYHNLNHISDLINDIPLHRFSGKELDLLILAIIFHDVIYEVGSKNNEIRSANFFHQCAKFTTSTTLTENETFAVGNIILSTKNHEPLEIFFPEFDLFALTSEMIRLDLNGFYVDNFLDYEKLVQKEFSTEYTWEEYKEGHIKFLEAYKHKVLLNKSVANIETLIEYCKNSTGFTYEN